jgi:hypothetical protein
LMGKEGPTGDFAEVLELRVEDYGGNVHWSGPVESYHPKRCGVTGALPMKLVATKLGRRGGCITSDYRADYAIESK